MDITSYLLGKKASGGGGSDLNWSAIGFSSTPQSIVDGYNYAVQIKNNWDATQTDLSNKFTGDTKLSIMPLVDTSNATNVYLMFKNCSCLTDVALFDTSNVTNFSNMFDGCKNLKTIPKFDTSSAQNMKSMFTGCTYLENIPVLDTSSLSGSNLLQSAFSSCNSLTNTSLDNILQMCIGATSYTGTKTLAKLGFNSTYQPAETIQGLPHYQAFIDKGWTIGY